MHYKLQRIIFFLFCFSLTTSYYLHLNAPTALAQTSANWFMAGANPQRTSWVSEEIRGGLNVEWYRPIEAYIPYKVQPIAVNGKIYVSSSKGLYGINATTGNVDFVYPTLLPLGHSPTIVSVNGRLTAYVGGYDKRIHAVDADTGQAISGYTPYVAGAGFETNPLVINNVIYAGNRDGKFYALNAVTGARIWEFPTNGPILFSAAYKDNVLYFASMDNYAYAVNTSGQQLWKQGPFSGQGFHSYWPVIYTEKVTGKDYVSFGGSENYRQHEKSLGHEEWSYFFPHCTDNDPNTPCPAGELIGPSSTASSNDNYWTPGTFLIDTNRIRSYHNLFPFRRTLFILDAANGQEYRFDSNNDGVHDYAPMTWSGVTHSGNRYPAVINAIDNIYYENTQYISMNTYIPRGDPVGWKFGTQQISRVGGSHAIDEPMAVAFGGKVMYWSLCCDRESGAFDVTIPFGQSGRSWIYVNYNFLNRAPDYRMMYNDGGSGYTNIDGWQVYSGRYQSKNGIYSTHGTVQSPPIPYQGRVYMLRGNAILSWRATSTTPTQLPLVTVPNTTPLTDTTNSDQLRQKLESEVQKMLSAGHLRPGYHAAGFLDQYGVRRSVTTNGFGEIFDYFQNPSDTVVTLLQALPHLSSTMQTQVRTYIQNNYGPGRTYDITRISHIGWGTGAAREVYSIPPDVWSVFGTSNGAPLNPTERPSCASCGYWTNFPPYNFYAAWKYAQVFGGASSIFSSMSVKLEAPVADSTLLAHPNLLNQYVAGYYGYLELQKLAGLPESSSVRSTYTRLLNLRTQNFSKDNPWWPNFNYRRALNIARNFIYLTPELAEHFNQQIRTQVNTAVAEYEYVAPYWFVSKYDASYGEGTLQPLYDYSALFQAKARVLKEPQQNLVRYLDVPAFPRGDLFYIQNVVAAIEAPSSGSGTASPTPSLALKPGDANGDGRVDGLDYVIWLNNYGITNATGPSQGDFNSDGRVDGLDYVVWLNNYGT